MAPRNMLGRLVVTTTYCVLATLIGCAFPFFGAFLALVRLAASLQCKRRS
jgi:hypothetical protein